MGRTVGTLTVWAVDVAAGSAIASQPRELNDGGGVGVARSVAFDRGGGNSTEVLRGGRLGDYPCPFEGEDPRRGNPHPGADLRRGQVRALPGCRE